MRIRPNIRATFGDSHHSPPPVSALLSIYSNIPCDRNNPKTSLKTCDAIMTSEISHRHIACRDIALHEIFDLVPKDPLCNRIDIPLLQSEPTEQGQQFRAKKSRFNACQCKHKNNDPSHHRRNLFGPEPGHPFKGCLSVHGLVKPDLPNKISGLGMEQPMVAVA